MKGIWVLLLLILTASLPAIIAFLWFRVRKRALTLPRYFLYLAAGMFSLLIAAFIQNFFVPFRDSQGGIWPVFLNVFVRIALVEEASRLLTLFPLFKAEKRRLNIDKSLGASLGLAAGFGFAALENIYYGIADINITLLRAFTAAPLHGACGIRAGAVVFTFGKHPVRAFFLFVSAAVIHGTYNLLIVNPVLPSALAIFAAYAAFFASLHLLKTAGTDDENIFISPPDP